MCLIAHDVIYNYIRHSIAVHWAFGWLAASYHTICRTHNKLEMKYCLENVVVKYKCPQMCHHNVGSPETLPYSSSHTYNRLCCVVVCVWGVVGNFELCWTKQKYYHLWVICESYPLYIWQKPGSYCGCILNLFFFIFNGFFIYSLLA